MGGIHPAHTPLPNCPHGVGSDAGDGDGDGEDGLVLIACPVSCALCPVPCCWCRCLLGVKPIPPAHRRRPLSPTDDGHGPPDGVPDTGQWPRPTATQRAIPDSAPPARCRAGTLAPGSPLPHNPTPKTPPVLRKGLGTTPLWDPPTSPSPLASSQARGKILRPQFCLPLTIFSSSSIPQTQFPLTIRPGPDPDPDPDIPTPTPSRPTPPSRHPHHPDKLPTNPRRDSSARLREGGGRALPYAGTLTMRDRDRLD